MKKSPITRQTKRILWPLTVLLAVCLVVAASFVVIQQRQASANDVKKAADEKAVKDVALKAFSAIPQVIVLKDTPDEFPDKHLDTPKDSSKSQLVASDEAIRDAREKTNALFKSIYHPDNVNIKGTLENLLAAIDQQKSGRYRATDWGVEDVEWRNVLVGDQTASVTIAAILWSKLQYYDETGKLRTSTPRTGMVMIYTLEKVDGQWLVLSEVQDTGAENVPADKQPVLTPPSEKPPVDQPLPDDPKKLDPRN